MQHISSVGILFIFLTKYYGDSLDEKVDIFLKLILVYLARQR